MLDLKFIRENIEAVRQNCAHRNIKVDLDSFEALDHGRRRQIQDLEEIRRLQNETAQVMKGKLDKGEREKLVAQGKELKDRAQKAEEVLNATQKQLDQIARQIPNMTQPDVPVGETEEDNRELGRWGKPTLFEVSVKDTTDMDKIVRPFPPAQFEENILRSTQGGINIRFRFIADGPDLICGADEAAHHSQAAYILSIILNVDRGRDLGDEVTQVSSAPDCFKLFALCQLAAHHDLIYCFIPLVKGKARLVDPLILLPVEVLRFEQPRDLGDRLGVDEDGAQHGLLGIEVVWRKLDA